MEEKRPHRHEAANFESERANHKDWGHIFTDDDHLRPLSTSNLAVTSFDDPLFSSPVSSNEVAKKL